VTFRFRETIAFFLNACGYAQDISQTGRGGWKVTMQPIFEGRRQLTSAVDQRPLFPLVVKVRKEDVQIKSGNR